MWIYKNKEFTSEDIGNYLGFVYIITNLTNNKKYVGKKLFKKTIKKPPLKGKKRKRISVIESDWKEYFGSSEEVKGLVEEHGSNIFKREILHLCSSKGELSYLEAKEQFDRDVLLRDDYYNGIINCRINKVHISNMKGKLNG